MPTILQIANADRNLSKLMKGLKATALSETLNAPGPFTIFAPINPAFNRIGSFSYEELMKKGNNATLAGILSYHIVQGTKLLKDFRDGQKLNTVDGRAITVSVSGSEVRLNGARILIADWLGSNGVIHSIDAVNLPV